jgi:hypothetical protein
MGEYPVWKTKRQQAPQASVLDDIQNYKDRRGAEQIQPKYAGRRVPNKLQEWPDKALCERCKKFLHDDVLPMPRISTGNCQAGRMKIDLIPNSRVALTIRFNPSLAKAAYRPQS